MTSPHPIQLHAPASLNPFSLIKILVSTLQQFVIKTNDEMTNTMALNTLEDINSQQNKKKTFEPRWNCRTCFNQRQLQLISFFWWAWIFFFSSWCCFVLKALCFNSSVKPFNDWPPNLLLFFCIVQLNKLDLKPERTAISRLFYLTRQNPPFLQCYKIQYYHCHAWNLVTFSLFKDLVDKSSQKNVSILLILEFFKWIFFFMEKPS